MTAISVRASDGMPGGAISVSANGNSDGVVWVSVHKEDATSGIHPGRLVGLDATNLNELWRDDDVPWFAKFNPPTITDGKVFLPTFAKPDASHADGLGLLIVYGLKPDPCQSIEDAISSTNQEITTLQDELSNPDLPPAARAALGTQLRLLNQNLASEETQLKNCQQQHP